MAVADAAWMNGSESALWCVRYCWMAAAGSATHLNTSQRMRSSAIGPTKRSTWSIDEIEAAMKCMWHHGYRQVNLEAVRRLYVDPSLELKLLLVPIARHALINQNTSAETGGGYINYRWRSRDYFLVDGISLRCVNLEIRG